MPEDDGRTKANEEYRFNISDTGQQIHIAFGENEPDSPRHPCFRVGSLQELHALKQRIYEHHVRGGKAAPMAADKPGEDISGQNLSGLFYLEHSGSIDSNQ